MSGSNGSHKIHFAWFVMAGFGFLTAGASSYSVIIGSFLTPAANALGVEISTLSYYFTFYLMSLAVALPVIGRVLPKVNASVAITTASVVMMLTGLAMSMFTEVWMFFVAAVVIGICSGFTCMVPMSVILGNWFKKKLNFAIGICWAFASVWMAVMSPIMSNIIDRIGYHMGFVVLAVGTGIVMIPSALILVRFSPADKGMLPYGYEEALDETDDVQLEAHGATFKQAIKSPAFYAVAMTLCIIQLTVCMNQLYPTYAESVGFGATVGGLMVSAASIFDIFLNILIGMTCDRMGAFKSLALWGCVSIVSFVLLLLSSTSPALAIFGAGVNDTMYVICGVGVTALAMEVFGDKEFGQIYSCVVAIAYIVGSFGAPLMTSIFEGTGSFQAVFIVCIILDIAIIGLGLLCSVFGKKLKSSL